MQTTRPQKIIFPLVLLSLLALLTGLWAGLIRLGWSVPAGVNSIPVSHGSLMVAGFLGTLISLERVVAIKQRWMFAAPVLSGTGWLAGLIFPGFFLGRLMITLASFFTVLILATMVRRESKIYTITMLVGVGAWLAGNLFWLAGSPVYRSVPWWAAFLILTISGERLELSRVLHPPIWQYILFGTAAGVLVIGVILSAFLPDPGWRLAGVGMLAMAAWLILFDIARRNLRHPAPLTRYIATCLFAGYFWLAAGGAFYLFFGVQQGGFYYDALLHSIFIGFVLSMIFGHAPIILPAVLNTMLPYHPGFYLTLALLHLSLAVRVAADLAGKFVLRLWGGLFNEIALLVFIAALIYFIRRGKTASRPKEPVHAANRPLVP